MSCDSLHCPPLHLSSPRSPKVHSCMCGQEDRDSLFPSSRSGASFIPSRLLLFLTLISPVLKKLFSMWHNRRSDHSSSSQPSLLEWKLYSRQAGILKAQSPHPSHLFDEIPHNNTKSCYPSLFVERVGISHHSGKAGPCPQLQCSSSEVLARWEDSQSIKAGPCSSA